MITISEDIFTSCQEMMRNSDNAIISVTRLCDVLGQLRYAHMRQSQEIIEKNKHLVITICLNSLGLTDTHTRSEIESYINKPANKDKNPLEFNKNLDENSLLNIASNIINTLNENENRYIKINDDTVSNYIIMILFCVLGTLNTERTPSHE